MFLHVHYAYSGADYKAVLPEYETRPTADSTACPSFQSLKGFGVLWNKKKPGEKALITLTKESIDMPKLTSKKEANEFKAKLEAEYIKAKKLGKIMDVEESVSGASARLILNYEEF